MSLAAYPALFIVDGRIEMPMRDFVPEYMAIAAVRRCVLRVHAKLEVPDREPLWSLLDPGLRISIGVTHPLYAMTITPVTLSGFHPVGDGDLIQMTFLPHFDADAYVRRGNNRYHFQMKV